MPQIIYSPSKYIQGNGEIARLGSYCLQMGDKGAYAIVDPFILSRYGQEIKDGFLAEQLPLMLREFQGECSLVQVEQMVAELNRGQVGTIVGIGGGKTLDTAKAVSHFANLPVLLVPTVASTDAPCSALAVLYSDSGEFDRYLPLRRSPDLVVADVAIIAGAPVRLLAAGMGDALSTYYEARACSRSGAVTSTGGTGTLAALALARTCLDTLLADGQQALKDASEGRVTAAVHHIVEANIYLSGIGFESGGLAAAHAIHNGLTLLEECRHVLHGEKVAFATLVQLILEGAEEPEIAGVVEFCRMAGLPVTLAAMGLAGVEQDRLLLAAEASCNLENSPMGNMPFAVTPQQVLKAMLDADRRGAGEMA
ncbi:glycerol dehydrogenase [Paenibacillus sp. FSL R7-0337]|uniref:glycerol dehydrogenase n=1 Tax=Paenibacillus sp. FSL R7-0337 TaxID=1926588 RepID=UPI00096E5D6F|nr:glycerol dehydrogenase [Paenibacillus sp. FSL R7-0337]OMF94898.1 glycerol dehydrogenase [Paenibacillus sp. FSL R7-0337]